MTVSTTIHVCRCSACSAGDHPERESHHLLNLILSRLNEQERRWVAAREALRLGHGGFQRVSEITGLHPETIRRGRDELLNDLRDRPAERIRLPGAGRPRVEKKIRR
jgi:DNA-directed RNA polymerase sigma subunit (sigma70/sigma32)